LTAPQSYGKARRNLRQNQFYIELPRHRLTYQRIDLDRIWIPAMVKPEWGTKRTCPKCGTRFYDLGKEDPATCIECGESWTPEAVLKSKQPMPFEAEKKDAKKEADTVDDEDLDVNIDDAEPSADQEVDLGGDDDLGVSKGKGDDEPDET